LVYQKHSQQKAQSEIYFYTKTYTRKVGILSRGYCVFFCISLNEKGIFTYSEHQEKENKEQLQLTFS